MTLYIKADHLEQDLQDFRSLNVLIDLITYRILDADLTEPEERAVIRDAMIALSDIAENAHARVAAALANSTIRPHDFSGESFKV